MHPQPPTHSLTKCRVGEGFIGEKENRLDGDTCKCPVPVFAVRACLEHRLQKRGKRQSGGGFGICQKLDLFTNDMRHDDNSPDYAKGMAGLVKPASEGELRIVN